MHYVSEWFFHVFFVIKKRRGSFVLLRHRMVLSRVFRYKTNFR